MVARILAFAALLSFAALAGAETPAWVERSNRIAVEVLRDRGQVFPEGPSSAGQEEFDTAVADFGPNLFERSLAQTEKRLAALRALRAAETDPKVRQDLDILIASREQVIETARLERRVLINYVAAPGIVNFGLSSLLDPRNRPERQARALVRLKRYAGLAPGTTLLATRARERTEEELARPGLIGPTIEEVRQQLNKTEFFLKGIAGLFEKAKLEGWQADFEVLARQLREYNDWARKTVLPRARSEIRLPPALYANRLKQVGVALTPEELIERSGADFQEVRDQMQVLAKQLATARKLPSADYRDVIRELKKRQVEPEAMLAMYRGVLKDIEAIIRREKLISLPGREAAIRFATESEAAQTPAPQMRIPRLIGNQGEYGEFLIPLTNPHAKTLEKMDDFSYEAVAWTLTAHEARPGHELQFASMVERGVSLARAIFAFNSANVEGWALYSEALMMPYLPPEAQARLAAVAAAAHGARLPRPDGEPRPHRAGRGEAHPDGGRGDLRALLPAGSGPLRLRLAGPGHRLLLRLPAVALAPHPRRSRAGPAVRPHGLQRLHRRPGPAAATRAGAGGDGGVRAGAQRR